MYLLYTDLYLYSLLYFPRMIGPIQLWTGCEGTTWNVVTLRLTCCLQNIMCQRVLQFCPHYYHQLFWYTINSRKVLLTNRNTTVSNYHLIYLNIEIPMRSLNKWKNLLIQCMYRNFWKNCKCSRLFPKFIFTFSLFVWKKIIWFNIQ